MPLHIHVPVMYYMIKRARCLLITVRAKYMYSHTDFLLQGWGRGGGTLIRRCIYQEKFKCNCRKKRFTMKYYRRGGGNWWKYVKYTVQYRGKLSPNVNIRKIPHKASFHPSLKSNARYWGRPHTTFAYTYFETLILFSIQPKYFIPMTRPHVYFHLNLGSLVWCNYIFWNSRKHY